MNYKETLRFISRFAKKRRYVFIVTYGRSGSTLLMNIINSSEGCCIRGENNATLYSIYQSYKKIDDAQKEHSKNASRSSSPWRGLDNINTDKYGEKLVKAFIKEIIRPGKGDLVLGFKEIRHSFKEAPDLDGYFDFIKKFFPNSKIIFNHRNISDVSSSKWWAKMPEARKIIEEMDCKFNNYKNSERFFHFYYDEGISKLSHVKDLFNFLELKFNEEKVKGVFSQKHSY